MVNVERPYLFPFEYGSPLDDYVEWLKINREWIRGVLTPENVEAHLRGSNLFSFARLPVRPPPGLVRHWMLVEHDIVLEHVIVRVLLSILSRDNGTGFIVPDLTLYEGVVHYFVRLHGRFLIRTVRSFPNRSKLTIQLR